MNRAYRVQNMPVPINAMSVMMHLAGQDCRSEAKGYMKFGSQYLKEEKIPELPPLKDICANLGKQAGHRIQRKIPITI